MRLSKQGLATLGLIFITFLAAIQYIFLRNIPDSVSTFAFICITNLIGVAVLAVAQLKKVLQTGKSAWKKGVLFALELTGFNFFTILGSKSMDAVIVSSVISLYFVFITPMLLLLKKRVNFFSSIATVIAILALLLMFGADTDALFSSSDVIYLIIADFFFAAYVVSVSVLGEKEDSLQLSFAQMVFSTVFAFVGWVIESVSGHGSLSIPKQADFWVSAVFIGIGIRAVYGILQISCQKYVSALKASLIFSAEVIITLMTNPIMCRLFNMEYTPPTVFQIIGGVFLIIATLMVDDTVLARIGYDDFQEVSTVNEKGETVYRSSVSKKMIFTTLTFSLLTMIVSTLICLSAISFIRVTSVSNSQKLGEDASRTSSKAIEKQLEENITTQVHDKTVLAEHKLSVYSDSVLYAAAYAHALYEDAGNYPRREVEEPQKKNAGKWAMQRTLADETVSYESMRDESRLLGNMQEIFEPIVASHSNISTIYLGTKDGLMVSYDPDSESAVEMGYYEYRNSDWYKLGKTSEGYAFTETYQDGYGRGLTITCVAPFTDADGQFRGCIAMDVLMSELNDSMVNDGIVDPSVAILIDHDGNYIAGKDVDPNAENMGNIFDEGRTSVLAFVGREILEKKEGIVSDGEGADAMYVAYGTIDTTDWTLCILSPVSTVTKPARTIYKSIDTNTKNVVGTVEHGILTVIQSCLVLSALLLLLITLFTGKYSKRISAPLKRLEADVREISAGNLEQRTQVDTDDEIGSLARSFNHMTDSLQKYIVDLKEATAKEERIASELSVATNIQASMLPQDFEAYSDRTRFDLYATMTPAKEVGGDFYDFFLIDDTHLALVMADVSGKGVPAALFMAKGKTSIKTRAMMGGTPAEILSDVNEQMCEGNEAELFVTVWLAIVDLETGKGMAANAGHEHPALRRADGSFELIKYRHSPAVATMEGIRFREHDFELHPGDSLFVYTDGVTEATDAHNELFGEERLVTALNKQANDDPVMFLKNVKEDIDAFVADAPQFDDITMLGITYFGSGGIGD